MHGRVLILFFLFVFVVVPSATSQEKSTYYFDASLHYGFVIVHSRELRPVKSSFPFGLDLGAGKQFYTRKAYESCKCSPKVGFNFQLWDYGNREILGRSAFLNFKIETPFKNSTQRLFPSAFFGTGLVYNTLPYDPVTNPNNQSYSTHLSFSLLAGFAANYAFTDHLYSFLAVNYNHSSNGGRKEPNKGINFPTASIGISYYPDPVKNKGFRDASLSPLTYKKHEYELRTFATTKNVSSSGDATYFVGGFNILYARHAGRIHYVTASNEWVWDTARRKKMENSGITDKEYTRTALLLGHEFHLGRVLFRQELGAYIFDALDNDDLLYQRYTLHYKVAPSLRISLGLKAHRHIADFLEIGASARL